MHCVFFPSSRETVRPIAPRHDHERHERSSWTRTRSSPFCNSIHITTLSPPQPCPPHPTHPSSPFHSPNQHSPSKSISQNVGFSPQKRYRATGRKGSNLRPSPVFNHNRFLTVWGVQHAIVLACFGPNTMCAPTSSMLQATYIHTYAGVLQEHAGCRPSSDQYQRAGCDPLHPRPYVPC